MTPPPGMTPERWAWLRSICAAMVAVANRGAGPTRTDEGED